MDEHIANRLRDLGIKEDRLEEYVTILSASTPEDAKRQIGEFSYGAGYSQVMLPMFRRLYQKEDVRTSVLKELEPSPIPPNVIDDYFMNTGTQPFLLLHVRHQKDIPLGTRLEFTFITADCIDYAILRNPKQCR